MPETSGACIADAADADRAAAAPVAGTPVPPSAPVVSEIPPSVQRFLELSRSPRFDVRDAAAVLAEEPRLAERLVRLSRLPLYGQTWPVADFDQAISSLGLNLAELAAVAFSVHPWSGQPCGCSAAADALRLRIGAAVAARSLALMSCLEVAEDVFLCGLLMDAAAPVPHDDNCPSGPRSAEPERARTRGGWPPARIASRLLERWGFHEAFVESLASYDGRFESASELHGLAASFRRCLSTARDLAVLALAEPFRAEAAGPVLRKCGDWFGWGTRDLRTIIRRLEEGIPRAFWVLGWDGDPPETWTRRLTRACSSLWRASRY